MGLDTLLNFLLSPSGRPILARGLRAVYYPIVSKRGLEYLLSDDKRQLDLSVGLVCALGALPVGLGMACVSAIDTRTLNPILTQKRLGGTGKVPSDVFKFRTIPTRSRGVTSLETFGTFDPRASRLGRWVRQTGLDEIPQLLNVIRGDMSLVGTRPLLEVDLVRNEEADPRIFKEWYEYFCVVKPGLIGRSQALRHHYTNSSEPAIFKRSMLLDLEYFQNATIEEDKKTIRGAPLMILRANIGIVDSVLSQ